MYNVNLQIHGRSCTMNVFLKNCIKVVPWNYHTIESASVHFKPHFSSWPWTLSLSYYFLLSKTEAMKMKVLLVRMALRKPKPPTTGHGMKNFTSRIVQWQINCPIEFKASDWIAFLLSSSNSAFKTFRTSDYLTCRKNCYMYFCVTRLTTFLLISFTWKVPKRLFYLLVCYSASSPGDDVQ